MWFLALAASLVAAAPLDLPPGEFSVSISSEPAPPGHRLYTVQFPSAFSSRFKPNNTVWAHLSVPDRPGPHPCVVVLPVMAAPNIWIETRFINRLRRDGFAVLWLEMPYQFNRRPHPSMPSGQVFLARTAKGLAANFRQSVLDARRAIQWISRHPEVDASRIGLFGISLGAIVASAVYSVDATPRFAVFLMGGADFPSLVVASSMTGPFVRRMQLTQAEVRRAWAGIDPYEYRARNAGKPALLINVRSDTVIPAANARRLHEAFPGSRQVWLPLGHYSAIAHLVWIPRYVSRAFQDNLGKKPIKTAP